MQKVVAQCPPSLAHPQERRTKIEAASRTDPVYLDRAERAEQRKMEFFAREVERNEHASGSSAAPSVAPGPTSSNAGDTRSGPVDEEDARCHRGEPVHSSDARLESITVTLSVGLSRRLFEH